MVHHPSIRPETRADTENFSSESFSDVEDSLARADKLAWIAPAALALAPDKRKMLWPAQIIILALIVVTMIWWSFLIDIGVALVKNLR
jgi:hypothetical protein